MRKRESTDEGFLNANRQSLVRQTETPIGEQKDLIYVMRCGDCGLQYGVIESEILERLCPNCQGGTAGLAY